MSAASALANVASYSLQVAVLALVGGLVAWLMRVRAPGAMLAYWQGLLALCLLLPVVQPWGPAAVDAGAVSWEITAARAAASGPRPALAPVLAATLVAGAILRLAWLALGLRRLAGCRARARPLVALPELLADLPDRLGVRARFYVSVEVGAPATFGHRDPVVLVPPAFLDMAPEAQRAVAAHELMHVQRRDWTLAAVEEAVRAALWFHPAVHWLLVRIRLCREQVVDQEVAGRLAGRRVYLEALLEVARGLVRTRPLPAAPMLREGHLKNRIELLLEEVSMSRTRIAVSMTAATMALVASAAVAAWSFPLRSLAPGDEPSGAAQAGPKRGPERKIVSKVNPVYPAEAKKDKVEGHVILDVTVEKSGEVSKVTAVKGPEALRDSAVTAVRQWRYEPSDLGATRMTITVRYVLDKDRSGEKP
jgi:bla regulator protein blaR1